MFGVYSFVMYSCCFRGGIRVGFPGVDLGVSGVPVSVFSRFRGHIVTYRG